jgi:transposase
MAVHARGLSDNEASAELDIHRSTWRAWRINQGLKQHNPDRRAQPLPEWVNELRMSLYLSGLTDRQIAEGAKCTTDAVKNWRVKRGLKRNTQQEMVSA